MDSLARSQWIATHILPFEPELRGWLRRQTRILGPMDVDDLIQEAFARVWAVDFSKIRNGRAYLYATVRHLLTANARHNRVVSIVLLGEIESLNLISEEPGPDREVGAWQELERIRAIVSQLPPQCRRVFTLRKFEGLSHMEIAQRMGITPKTVINHLTRALSQVADGLASDDSKPVESPTAGHGARWVRDDEK